MRAYMLLRFPDKLGGLYFLCALLSHEKESEGICITFISLLGPFAYSQTLFLDCPTRALATSWSRQIPFCLGHTLPCSQSSTHKGTGMQNSTRACIVRAVIQILFFEVILKIPWEIDEGWIHKTLKCQSWKAV
jgi:hypothetical protein